MSTSDGSSWKITNSGTPTPGNLNRPSGYTHDDSRQICAKLQSLSTAEHVSLAIKYVKTRPKQKAQALTESRLAKIYEPLFDQVDADRAKSGLKPSKPPVTSTTSSYQEHELADATVRRKVESLTMFDGKDNGDLEATKGHSPPLVREGYVPLAILDTVGGRFISVLEKQEAFVSK